MAIERLLTVEDYHAYVNRLGPDERTPELMNGRYVMAARPVIAHMRYVRAILKAIEAYVDAGEITGEILLECEVVLDAHTILIPDIAFHVEQSALGSLTPERFVGAPDFVCEILSPSTRDYDMREKYLAYLKSGVREYWLVDYAAPAGERFTLYESVAQPTAANMPIFARIEGTPSASRIFPGIAIDARLL